MSTLEKVASVQAARGLSKFFKLEITLSMFGKVIFHWVYPPQNSDSDEEA